MAISRLAQNNGAAGSATLSGTFNTNDFILLLLQNTGAATTPNLPTGYTNITSGSDAVNNHAMRLCYKYAANGSETMPAFTNTTSVSWSIYTGVALTSPAVQIAGQAGVSTSMSSSGITTFGNPGVDWVIIGATGTPITGNIGVHPPTSMTLTTEYKTTLDDNALFDSNAPLSTYSFNTKTLDASVSWITKTFELVAATGGGGTPTNLFFF